MTPAVKLAQKQKIKFNLHQYEHDPASASYGLEAAEKLAVAPAYVFKTLLAQLDTKDLVVAILPVNQQLNLKLLAKAAGSKKAVMANPTDVERTTGYLLGGVSPLGQKKRLKTFICQSAQKLETMFVSGGKRGLEIELTPQDLLKLTFAHFSEITS
ncbi:Cys-tRNA(Pro) deacylase [Catenovulum sp. 2E275]|uniref:Cys-tRNA(Pro) deacylase n=1 Tax=Catenovulum sp. 2E275 TaxID=2980497 RepID=UPI0021D3B0E7|nr:Cys-tRNA(Pro) deacylase [Catenovulum sp. 2E275]MCU4675157.1 Cys-tRNA(Pro) deacylase [Catenovulum sp. 2E275]